MEHSNSFYGAFSHGFLANNMVLEAAMACVQALSRTKLDDHVRCHVLGKLLEGFGAASFGSKGLPSTDDEDEATNKFQHPGVFFPYRSSKVKSSEPLFENEREKFLSSFLRKAVAHGALELKDINSVLQCFDEANRESLIGKGDGLSKTFTDTLCKGNLTGNGDEDEHMRENVGPHGPLDNNQPVIVLDSVSNAAPCPKRKALSSSFEVQPSPPLHVTQEKVSLSFCNSLADGSGLGDVHGPHARTNCTFSEVTCSKAESSLLNKAVSCEKKEETHVNSLSSPLSFLEAATQEFKNSSSHSLLNEKKFDKEPVGSKTAPSLSDGSPTFKVDHHVLQKRMDLCRFSVVGKLTLAKGDAPWTWLKLKKKLDDVWKMTDWRLISLGKGFFHIILKNQDVLNRVWSKGILQMNPGILRLQRWFFGFDPTKEKITSSQVWYRIYQLPWCLWDSTVLNGIAKHVGVPVRIDRTSLEGSFGHYARVLVEVDHSKQVTSTVLIDCCNKLMEVHIVPESHPPFCQKCKAVGHLTKDCRLLCKKEEGPYPNKSIKAVSDVNLGFKRDERPHTSTVPFSDLAPPVISSHSSVSRRGSQSSIWRIKEAHGMNKDSECLHQRSKTGISNVTNETEIFEMVTDFSAHLDPQPTFDASSDPLFLSNQFSVLDLVNDDKEPVQKSDIVAHQEPSTLCCDDEEITIPKLPKRWSDILDDEEIKDSAPMIETIITHGIKPIHMGDQIDMPSHPHPRKDIMELRAQIQDLWVNRDDSKYDRDMFAEIEPRQNSHIHTKSLLTHIPVKDKKIKIGFRQSHG